MQALLGKITNIASPEPTGAGDHPSTGDLRSLEVKFKPACLLPRRAAVPEWLKDQVLTLKRVVHDPREVGGMGDSLVLTPDESARWLYPLEVRPAVVHGEVPATLQLRLRWWKDEKLPEFTVRANGRQQSGQFVKDGDEASATVETGALFDFPPHLPLAIEVTCDQLKAACTVIPKQEPGARRLLLPEGEVHRLENGWYTIQVIGHAQGGGIQALQEKGRGVDHFRGPANLIHKACEYAGHVDRFSSGGWGWSEPMEEAALTCSGARRGGGTVQLGLEGVVDEGQNLRTSVTYTLYDELPLLLLERTFQLHKGKGGDKDKEKVEKPKEPIDDMKPVRLGFRAAWWAEREERTGSRLLCTDGERLVITRPPRAGDWTYNEHWRMAGGWAVAEHPGRRESMLYLFDAQAPPHLSVWTGQHTLTLEPFWPHRPVRPEEAVGFSVALTAGEICGATSEGAWVASRAARLGGGIVCGVVARLRDTGAPVPISFAVAGERIETHLESTLLPGVGRVSYATAVLPDRQIQDPFDVAVGRIDRRRER